MAIVFVGYATRSGTAADIAAAAARVLREAGHEVTLGDLKTKPPLPAADLVVLGSGIHAGLWYAEAVSWINANAARLGSCRVAVFNACLNAASPDKRETALGYNRAASSKVQAISSESFAGRFVPEEVSWFRRTFLRAMQQPPQDHLDLDAVRRWAATLAL